MGEKDCLDCQQLSFATVKKQNHIKKKPSRDAPLFVHFDSLLITALNSVGVEAGNPSDFLPGCTQEAGPKAAPNPLQYLRRYGLLFVQKTTLSQNKATMESLHTQPQPRIFWALSLAVVLCGAELSQASPAKPVPNLPNTLCSLAYTRTS